MLERTRICRAWRYLNKASDQSWSLAIPRHMSFSMTTPPARWKTAICFSLVVEYSAASCPTTHGLLLESEYMVMASNIRKIGEVVRTRCFSIEIESRMAQTVALVIQLPAGLLRVQSDRREVFHGWMRCNLVRISYRIGDLRIIR